MAWLIGVRNGWAEGSRMTSAAIFHLSVSYIISSETKKLTFAEGAVQSGEQVSALYEKGQE